MRENLTKEEFYGVLDEIKPGERQRSMLPGEIYFEKLSMAGLDEMHRYSIDERLYEFLEFGAFKTIDETRAYLERLIDRTSAKAEQRTAMYWFVRRKDDSVLVGTAGIVNISFDRKSAEWGYGVDPSLWGHGYILQIQQMMKEYVFEDLKLNRLEGQTMIENKRTIASLLAAGMKEEGILREFYCKDGVFHDAWKYAMLRADYISESKGQEKNGMYLFSEHDVVKIISSILDGETVDADSTMHNTAGWDSMAHMAIMVALFEKTQVQLSPMQVANATSVRYIADLINGKQKTR